ncbi:MAG: DUF5606 domain-containing protein [Crocinitomicaceae bacterium]|nr:DUF5606 domain-containing protein [Crocinitomicaceae bacterium]MBK8925106.1 DUF5606 domain-containing protein [Crocinitomicaceae bacterium]
MDLQGVIAISGKPGLYKVVAQGKNNIIVESLDNGKKFPAFASDKISALDDISIYTYDEDVPLIQVYVSLAEKEEYKKSINHKEEAKKLREYLITFLPNYDAERVYDTDVKKLFQWYNILVDKGFITEEKVNNWKKLQSESEEKEEKSEVVTAETEPEKKPKKKSAKKEI